MMSLATMTSSEHPGIPPSPKRMLCMPSWISPPTLRLRSSQWSTTVIPNDAAYFMARRIRPESITGIPSSLMATAPSERIAPMSASLFPLLPFEIAPIGWTWTVAVRRARSTMKLVT